MVRIIYFGLFFLVVGCSGPQPILYPNDHFKMVKKGVADQDVATCKQYAQQSGASSGSNKTSQAAQSTTVGVGAGAVTGAVGGAIAGSAGRGAVIGAATGATAGLLRGLFKSGEPSQAYIRFVNRCLSERGYEVVGWE